MTKFQPYTTSINHYGPIGTNIILAILRLIRLTSMDVSMFLHIRFLMKTFATEFAREWSKIIYNFSLEKTEYGESKSDENTNLVSVCINKCVESVELLLNCLLQMWHWKTFDPFCRDTLGWCAPSSICDVPIVGVIPCTRRAWILNKIY